MNVVLHFSSTLYLYRLHFLAYKIFEKNKIKRVKNTVIKFGTKVFKKHK